VSEKPRDEKEWEAILARRYRESSAEQPTADLDEAILAAARRAAGAGPRVAGEAPGRRGRFRASRWSAPLAAAAVIVLAVALTVMLEREPEVTDLGGAARQQPVAPTPAETTPQRPIEARKQPLPAPPAAAREPASAAVERRGEKEAREQETLAHAPEPQAMQAPRPSTGAADGAAVADALTQSRESLGKAEEAADAASPAARQRPAPAEAARAAVPAPEQRLRDIEALYDQGRSDAADRALAGFCRDFPAYRLPERLAPQALRLGPPCGPAQ
jgi:hypothetical protein